ncbi:MAG TPA: N-ethylammeline chlorohydrolase [Acidobacteria bacterium]|nr:N-ethylammeline chlorohydrolase [Acidobacteriota bacterium]
MSESYDLWVRGGTVVPMVKDGEWFTGDVLVRQGRIAAVTRGSAGEVRADEVLDAEGCLVLPGLIQSHVHVVQSLLRHNADNLELLDWLKRRTWPYEASLDGDGVEAAARLGFAELLCGGTTTVLDFGTTHDHDRVFAAAEAMGIRCLSGKTHMDVGDGVPAGLLEDTERSLAEAEELGRRWHGAAGGRLRYAVAPRFALSCSRRLLTGCAELARDNGWLLQTHASENRNELAEVRRRTGMGNIEYLQSVGMTGPDVILAHGVHLDDADREILSATGTGICHCPGANLKLASGIADVPAMLRAGITVGLGADGAPCNNRLSAFHEMALAGTLHNVRHGPKAVNPWTVLAMVTRTAARLLHLEETVGTLHPGMAADVVVLDGNAWPLLPGGDPAVRVVHGASACHVLHTVVSGRIVVHDGILVADDPVEVTRRSREAADAVFQRMEELVT